MNKTWLTLLFLVICLFPNHVSLAQTADSTKKAVAKIDSLAQLEKSKADTLKSNKFSDQNANGIDDKLEKDQRHRKRLGNKDKFIDSNGDGICDNRESAFGLKKAFRKRKGRK
ncbi:MAG: hypothetical protein V2J62_03130 [candidate division KSB1 bacterium]|jgi:hypothetical protein|nr:hypothetical protein [candidate division KSB1 bacterium]